MARESAQIATNIEYNITLGNPHRTVLINFLRKLFLYLIFQGPFVVDPAPELSQRSLPKGRAGTLRFDSEECHGLPGQTLGIWKPHQAD